MGGIQLYVLRHCAGDLRTQKTVYDEVAKFNIAESEKGCIFIITILIIESIGQLSINAHFFDLTPSQMLIGGSLSFVIHLFGAVLPVLFFIYAILLTRYMRLSNSVLRTTIYGGCTYAAFHLFEYWTVYQSLELSIVSVCFICMQFVAPGMVKSYLTLRTGNAWVHAWAYHAIAPHVIIDTPHIVKYFRI